MIDSAAPGRPVVERTSDLRVARLHLRGGTHALARAELEGLAGRDALDRDGILDLAEVRWRTGDLAGAAVAAAAWLDDGDDTGAPGVLAHVISAEAAAARGAMDATASHLAAAAPRLGDCGTLDAILAGIVARAAWPGEAAAAFAAPPAAMADAASPAVAPALPVAAETPIPALPPGVAVAPAAAQLARAGAGLIEDAPERAVILLALALRADQAAAEAVLAALDAADPRSTHAAAFAFVRAEALRAADREDESRIAYALAESLALAPVEAGAPRRSQ